MHCQCFLQMLPYLICLSCLARTFFYSHSAHRLAHTHSNTYQTLFCHSNSTVSSLSLSSGVCNVQYGRHVYVRMYLYTNEQHMRHSVVLSLSTFSLMIYYADVLRAVSENAVTFNGKFRFQCARWFVGTRTSQWSKRRHVIRNLWNCERSVLDVRS